MRRWVSLLGMVLAAALLRPAGGFAQTASDSAQAVLETANLLEQDGQHELARRLLRYLRQRWPQSPAALAAAGRIEALPPETLSSFARTSFIAYHTLYGAFLGVAVPAALGADDPEPFGAGLLIGAPLGFFGSRAFGRSRALTEGQTGILQFGSFWGTWMGFALQEALDLGEQTTCDFDVCSGESPATARWASAVIGGVAGLGAGWLASRSRISDGKSTLIFHGSLWGSWYGIVAGLLADAEDDDLLLAALLGGNSGLLLAIPAANRWRPSCSRIRIASAAGLAGGLAGLGAVLLLSIEGEKEVITTTAAATTLGLILGASLGRDRNDPIGSGGTLLAPALLSGADRLRLGLPLPVPARLDLTDGRTVRGWRIPLLDTRF